MRSDVRDEKWMGTSINLGDGISLDVRELQSVRDLSIDARDARDQCLARGIHPVAVVDCRTSDGAPHAVLMVGEFAIDHAREWVTPMVDLDYDWCRDDG
jgi:hypothetical protein